MRRMLHAVALAVVVVLTPAVKIAMAAELNGGTPGTLLGEESQSFVGYVQNAEWLLPEGADETQPRLTPVQWGAGGWRNVRCESQSDRYAYCPTYTSGRVRLQRQLSNAPCRQYETWGTEGDGSGIWVRNGCRAIFSVGRGGGGEGWGGGGGGWGGGGSGGGRSITCRSEHFDYNRCPVYHQGRRVRLIRQLSDASCVRGSSWGLDREGIWVNNGCAAEFTIR